MHDVPLKYRHFFRALWKLGEVRIIPINGTKKNLKKASEALDVKGFQTLFIFHERVESIDNWRLYLII